VVGTTVHFNYITEAWDNPNGDTDIVEVCQISRNTRDPRLHVWNIVISDALHTYISALPVEHRLVFQEFVFGYRVWCLDPALSHGT
jgi:hypothetical protein